MPGSIDKTKQDAIDFYEEKKREFKDAKKHFEKEMGRWSAFFGAPGTAATVKKVLTAACLIAFAIGAIYFVASFF